MYSYFDLSIHFKDIPIEFSVVHKIFGSIRIRIRILLRILISELNFMFRRNPLNFIWTRKSLGMLLCPRTGRRVKQIDRKNFLCAFFEF